MLRFFQLIFGPDDVLQLGDFLFEEIDLFNSEDVVFLKVVSFVGFYSLHDQSLAFYLLL